MSKFITARTGNIAGNTVVAFAAIMLCVLVASCGWVDSAGQGESENILLGLAQADVAEQINVTAETPQLVDLTVLAESNGVSPNTLQWRARGAGDANNCAAFENRNDISLSLEKACDESIYQTDATVSTVATNTASSEPTSAPDACMVVIIERDSDNTESALFEIHAPALTQPVALAYTIESVSGDGIVGLAHDVNLCIEP